LKRPRISGAPATTGRSRTAGASDTRANTSAITPPPRCAHKPTGLPESKLSRSRRRHSSRISMRQVQPILRFQKRKDRQSSPHDADASMANWLKLNIQGWGPEER
jgi:hypothetical protein